MTEASEMTKLKLGFVHRVEHIRDGVVLDVEEIHNLVPDQGLDYILNAALRGTTPITAWYVALFEGNYTPTSGITASTFPATATECTTYDEATRVVWTSAAASGGIITNSASKAVFTINATKTVYGVAMSSVAAKSDTGGVLTSVARFASAKNVVDNDILNVTSTLTLTSA